MIMIPINAIPGITSLGNIQEPIAALRFSNDHVGGDYLSTQYTPLW